MGTPLYDAFSDDYDRFVDWEGRLAYELPFLQAQLKAVRARRVLDVACGTGVHALALSERGYDVVGADVSAGMIARARENAAAAGQDVRFVVAGFGALAEAVEGGFDALLCLGNSLPHVLTAPALAAALDDMAACLRPGGLLFIQNRNFDRVLQERQRWMPPQGHHKGEREWVFMRFYDWVSDTRLTFNVVTLYREGAGAWQQRVTATELWPLRQGELIPVLAGAGFGRITCWGDMQGAPFDRVESPNLIITARC
jgi:glycine/sarcosine N-methyltransferase